MVKTLFVVLVHASPLVMGGEGVLPNDGAQPGAARQRGAHLRDLAPDAEGRDGEPEVGKGGGPSPGREPKDDGEAVADEEDETVKEVWEEELGGDGAAVNDPGPDNLWWG